MSFSSDPRTVDVLVVGAGITGIYQLYRALQQAGLGGDGNHALVKAVEKLAGLEVRAPGAGGA